MLAVPGCLEGLGKLLAAPPSQHLALELAWLLASAAAAAADAHLALLSRAGCFAHALNHLRRIRQQEVSFRCILVGCRDDDIW